MSPLVAPKILSGYLKTLASRVECPPFEGGDVPPTLFDRAEGAMLFDLDGKPYVDFCNGKGSIIVGHNDSEINRKTIESISRGENVVTGPTTQIIELGQRLLEMVPFKEHGRVAFFPTGTESLRAAATILRDNSKQVVRSIILSSGWHGWDPMWRSSGQLLHPNPEGVVDVYFIPELLEAAVKKFGTRVVGFVFSPDYGHLSLETLKSLLKICRANGVKVVCDDVKQGLRYGPFSSLQMIDEVADVYVFSKGLSNGRRLSCILGHSSVMQPAASLTYTSYFESSAVAAALGTLTRMVEVDGYASIRNGCNSFVEGATKLFLEQKIPAVVKSSGALFQFIFPSDELALGFYRSAFQNGLIFYYYDNQAPSAAFGSEVVEDALSRLKAAVKSLEMKVSQYDLSISEERYFWTAWRQMDGATDAVPAGRQIDMIETALRAGKL